MFQLCQKGFFRSLQQTPQLLKVRLHKVASANGANLGPVGQCDLTFRLGNKQSTNKLIILWDLCRNIIVGINWQCDYRIGCNWNINGQQDITHNNKFLWTNIPSSHTEPIVCNSGSTMFPPSSVSVLSIKAPAELNTRICTSCMLLITYHQVFITGCRSQVSKVTVHTLLNNEHNTVQIQRKTVVGKVHPIDMTDS